MAREKRKLFNPDFYRRVVGFASGFLTFESSRSHVKRGKIIIIQTLSEILIDLGIPDTRESEEFRRLFVEQGKSFLYSEFLRRRIDLKELEITNQIFLEKSR